MAEFDLYPVITTVENADTLLVRDVSDNSVIPAGKVKQVSVEDLLAAAAGAGLAPNGNGSQLTGITPGQVGALALPAGGTYPGTASEYLDGSGHWTAPPTGGGGGGGTVTTVSVVTANGLAGTVANPTTAPAVTLTTSVTGLVKGNGTALTAATPGTDYVAPTGSGATLTGITPGQVGADASGAAAGVQANLTAEVSRATTAEGLKAPLISPALTGTPTAPTATALTSTTQLATTAYADSAVGVETTRATTAEGLKAPLASPALTGAPTAPTQTTADSSTKIATTAFVGTAVGVETTRATGAEGTLTTSVAAKVSKAGDTMTGKLSPTVTVVAFASTVTLPVTTNVMSLTLTGACTLNAPTTANDGDVIRVRILGANAHTLTLGTGWNWGAAGAPAFAGVRDRIVAEFVASSPVWDAAADPGHT